MGIEITVSILFIFVLIIFIINKLKNQQPHKNVDTIENVSYTSTSAQSLNNTPSIQKEIDLPKTIKEPFEETPNITLDDFTIFKGSQILLVEDSKLNQKIVLSILKKSGIKLTIANNGKEALKILLEEGKVFDLILMDISMPVMDGYTATQAIRENSEFNVTPIITFTAFSSGKEIGKMYDLGANGHLTKPLNIAQLFTAFKTYLKYLDKPVSMIEMMNIQGLDIEKGIIAADQNEERYKQRLREFVLLYGPMVESISSAIEKNDLEHVYAQIIKISNVLPTIGAYELGEIVARMKKIFIYKTSHRIDEFKDIFPQTLKKLIVSINLYLTEES